VRGLLGDFASAYERYYRIRRNTRLAGCCRCRRSCESHKTQHSAFLRKCQQTWPFARCRSQKVCVFALVERARDGSCTSLSSVSSIRTQPLSRRCSPRILSSWAIALEAMDAAATATKTEDRIVLCCVVDVFKECAALCANLSKV